MVTCVLWCRGSYLDREPCVLHDADADLTVMEDETVPRPEEERVTQAEKNKRMQEQLKVGGTTTVLHHTTSNYSW